MASCYSCKLKVLPKERRDAFASEVEYRRSRYPFNPLFGVDPPQSLMMPGTSGATPEILHLSHFWQEIPSKELLLLSHQLRIIISLSHQIALRTNRMASFGRWDFEHRHQDAPIEGYSTSKQGSHILVIQLSMMPSLLP
jgi:hypothetical protein